MVNSEAIILRVACAVRAQDLSADRRPGVPDLLLRLPRPDGRARPAVGQPAARGPAEKRERTEAAPRRARRTWRSRRTICATTASRPIFSRNGPTMLLGFADPEGLCDPRSTGPPLTVQRPVGVCAVAGGDAHGAPKRYQDCQEGRSPARARPPTARTPTPCSASTATCCSSAASRSAPASSTAWA